MSEEKLYAVKNDEGVWLSFDPSHESVWYTNNPTFFKDKSYAEAQSIGRKAHVVELVEAPEKVVVSEEEAKMLKKAKDITVWRPAAVISKYAYNAVKDSNQEVLLEDRLMRACVNGYTVEKEKKYNVKVPETQTSYYYKGSDGHVHASDISGGLDNEFSYSELQQYGLDGERFTKEEVTDDDD